MNEKTTNNDYLKNFYNYLIKTMNGMAFGLFSTLIIGTIIQTIGKLAGLEQLYPIATLLKSLTGVGIGIGVAWSLKLDGLRLIAAGVAGGIGSNLKVFGTPGDPMVEYITVIAAIEGVGLVYQLFYLVFGVRKTAIDIILIPLLSALIAYVIFYFINVPVSNAMNSIGQFITWATERQPFIMGVIIAVVMGMILTAPISSAAIAISISLGGIAGGASVVGCAVQMLGFAVHSRKDNNIGGVISVGIGTSMLQFKNIMKKPIIWLPTIIVSAILGPLATIVFKTQCLPIGAGMGTSGLVGQVGTFDAMQANPSLAFQSIIILEILLPIILVYIVDIIFRKKGWIKEGDFKL